VAPYVVKPLNSRFVLIGGASLIRFSFLLG